MPARLQAASRSSPAAFRRWCAPLVAAYPLRVQCQPTLLQEYIIPEEQDHTTLIAGDGKEG